MAGPKVLDNLTVRVQMVFSLWAPSTLRMKFTYCTNQLNLSLAHWKTKLSANFGYKLDENLLKNAIRFLHCKTN